jgi:hypothetical protein
MILVDLEGVLTDHTDRLSLLQSRTADNKRDRTAWKDYYKAIMEDQPRTHIMDMVHDWLDADIRPIIYSTRFVNKWKHEEEWLRKHDLLGRVELIQRLPHQTAIKGPDLVLQWVRQHKPEIVIDDRVEVRDKLRGLYAGMMVYGPNAFLNTGENDGHSLR